MRNVEHALIQYVKRATPRELTSIFVECMKEEGSDCVTDAVNRNFYLIKRLDEEGCICTHAKEDGMCNKFTIGFQRGCLYIRCNGKTALRIFGGKVYCYNTEMMKQIIEEYPGLFARMI